MKIYSIVFLLILQSVSTFAQAPKKKIIGGMAENDSIWKIDVEMAVAAFVDLRLFLAEFQVQNKAIFLTKLDAGTIQKITELDSLYQNEILLFTEWFTRKSITKRRKKFAYSHLFRLVRSQVRPPTPPLRRISVSDLRPTYSTVLDLHHIKTPEEGLFFVQRCSQYTLG